MQSMRQAMTAYGLAAETQAPVQQIVLLYDGAIRRIKEARRALEERQVKERCVAVAKATAIIDGLQAALDHERGGEIAANLDRIYTYLGLRLQSVNLTQDPSICDELVERLGELRASWAALASGRPTSGAAPGRAPTPAPATAGADAGIEVTI